MTGNGFSIDTPRLTLREFRADDAADLFALNSNGDVMRYTGEAPFPDQNAAQRFVDNYSHYREHGFGRWAVEDRQSGRFMGFCGLHRRDTDEVDLAFRLFPEYWAAGYATEASKACLVTGFQEFGLAEILGRAMRENLPSISVLQKLEMSFRRMTEDQGLFWLIYGIRREVFERRNSS